MNLYYAEALALAKRERAARIQDVNAGMNGGKDADKLIKQLQERD